MIPIAKPLLGTEEKNAVAAVLESGALSSGKVVGEFEKQLAQKQGFSQAIAMCNGTVALHAALLTAGVKAGSEVATPDFSFIASATSSMFIGAQPGFCDVRQDTFNVDVASLQKVISPKTSAIMPVSLYGLPYDVEGVLEVARQKSLPVISDNCQAIGAKHNGKTNFGEGMAVLSFYPTKNITTSEGGAVLTDNEEYAAKLRLLRNQGMKSRYEYDVVGFNYRMTNICAAIGLEQLKKLDAFTNARRKNAKMLDELLSGVEQIETPIEPDGYTHVYHQYTIKAQRRDGLQEHLEKNGVASVVYYPQALHEIKTLAGCRNVGCANALDLSRKVLSLPVHPSLTEEDVQAVASAVKSFYK